MDTFAEFINRLHHFWMGFVSTFLNELLPRVQHIHEMGLSTGLKQVSACPLGFSINPIFISDVNSGLEMNLEKD